MRKRKTFYLKDMPSTDYYRINEYNKFSNEEEKYTTIKARHDNNASGWERVYVWLKLDENNIVTGIYCSSSMYDNRLWSEVGIRVGDKFIYEN